MRSAILEQSEIAIFEIGFGTGLNAFLTAIHAIEKQRDIFYTAVETAPLPLQEAATLHYTETLGHAALFQQLHECRRNEEIRLNKFFTIRKAETDLTAFSSSQLFDLTYYDAFAPSAQPELWTKDIFEKLYHMLHEDGVLVTYCSNGDVRIALLARAFM